MGTKRPFTLFLCLLLLIYLMTAPFYLFSLDREDIVRGGQAKPPTWEGVITLWDVPRTAISGSTFGWIKSRISAFEEENQGVFIDLRELDYDNNKEILHKGVQAQVEERPDIVPVFIEKEPLPTENIEPLDQWIKEEVKNQIQEEFLRAVTYESNLCALPFAASGNVLLLNKDLLQEIGCKTPQENEWTYEEFIKFIETIEEAKEEEEEILTFDAYVGTGEGSVQSILLSDGGQIFQMDQQRFAFYQPEMVSGFQKLLNIKNKASTHEEFGMRDKNDVYEDFLENKKTAILAADSSLIYVLERLRNKGEGFNYEVMTFPKGAIDIPIWYSTDISGYALMKKDNKEKQAMAVKFLEFLVQEDSQQTLKSLGAFPVNKGIRNLYEEEAIIKEWFEKGYEYQIHPMHPKWREIESKLIECIQLVLTEKSTPTQALKNLQNQVENE